ncbi:MAG: glutamate 5-kinase, partial [Gammaproteobacteria bacterium]
PRNNPGAELIYEGQANNPEFQKMAGPSAGTLGRGGMSTKITAAQRAARSGTATLITSGRTENALLRIASHERLGTLLLPDNEPVAARKQWLANHLKVQGMLHLDEGAVKMLRTSGKSLLPVGVTSVTGNFVRGEMVTCVAPDGSEVARGLVNYNAIEAAKIKGRPTSEIEAILGYIDEPELVHRDNLVLL